MWVVAKIKIYAVMFAGFVVVLGVAILKGMSVQKAKEAARDAKEYRETSKRIADAPTDDPIKRLRERLNKRGL